MLIHTCILSYIYPFGKQQRAEKTIQSKRKKYQVMLMSLAIERLF